MIFWDNHFYFCWDTSSGFALSGCALIISIQYALSSYFLLIPLSGPVQVLQMLLISFILSHDFHFHKNHMHHLLQNLVPIHPYILPQVPTCFLVHCSWHPTHFPLCFLSTHVYWTIFKHLLQNIPCMVNQLTNFICLLLWYFVRWFFVWMCFQYWLVSGSILSTLKHSNTENVLSKHSLLSDSWPSW